VCAGCYIGRLRYRAVSRCRISTSAGPLPSFDVKGTVTIANLQTTSAPTIVYSYGGTKLSSDFETITQVMVQQANEELQKNGRSSTGGDAKTVGIKVTSLVSEYIAFFWKSHIDFQVTLGNGQTFTITAHHASGVVDQDIDGCIAEGVIALFADQRLKSYLAS
jgi:hypothetical protein